MKPWTPFLITFLAGISTLFGTTVIFFRFKKIDKIIASSLAFAAGVMITISFTDLIPESIALLTNQFNKTFSILLLLTGINIGVIISTLIENYFPNNFNINDVSLYRVGIISMIAIILHNIPEGMVTFMISNQSVELGISLAIAIAMHNIPEGISISVPIYYATNNRLKAVLYTFISGISELFGAIITYLFLKNYINDFLVGILFAFIAGIMIHISLFELLPTSKNYNNKKNSFIFLLLGIVFMIINHLIF